MATNAQRLPTYSKDKKLAVARRSVFQTTEQYFNNFGLVDDVCLQESGNGLALSQLPTRRRGAKHELEVGELNMNQKAGS